MPHAVLETFALWMGISSTRGEQQVKGAANLDLAGVWIWDCVQGMCGLADLGLAGRGSECYSIQRGSIVLSDID